LIIPDANLFLYAYNQRSPQFVAAARWLEVTLSGDVEVGIPFQSILAFLRIATNPNLVSFAISMPRALDIVDVWLDQSEVRLIHPGPAHWSIYRRLCLHAAIGARLTTDAHLATLAIEHDATLMTVDADFARFPGLRWHNPLAHNS
jgi:toxin-antitoxin system PIN domain toxin